MTSAKKNKILSIIIPCYNEQEVIKQCNERVASVLDGMPYDAEIIYINDGSRDDTLKILKELSADDPRIVVLALSRNFGKEAAMTAGLDHSKGDAVIILDADLQDPPELIPELVKIWQEEKVPVVYGQRISRSGETWFKRVSAFSFYRIINSISGKVDIPVNTGDFRLMSRRAVDTLLELREHHRFMKGMFAWIGYKQVPLEYHRDPRLAGRTKWDYLSLWNLSLEGITGFSMAPLRIATIFGFIISAFAFILGCTIMLKTLILGSDVPGYPSIMVMVTFMGGIQLLTIGILGEYVGRIFNETKKRPLYVLDDVITDEP